MRLSICPVRRVYIVIPADAPSTKKAMAYDRPEGGGVAAVVWGSGGAEVWGGAEDDGDDMVANSQCLP